MKQEGINQVIINQAESNCKLLFEQMSNTALINQKKVLDAFRSENVALRHFTGTSGYGYDDVGRDTLCRVYANVFACERALVSPLISSGTQALTIALFAVLRPGDTLLSISGSVYDTITDVISGQGVGSLAEFGVKYSKVDLQEGEFDTSSIMQKIGELNPRVIYIQRSRGYEWRNAISIEQIERIITLIRRFSKANKLKDVVIMVDNCYGEFVDVREPTQVGCNLAIGSLIKNVGGGIAQTGGYIVGDSKLVELCEKRFISPSTGYEVGSYAVGYQYLYQGLFMAPHIVLQALKTSMLFSSALQLMGYEVLPDVSQPPCDLICSIKFNSEQKLINFCRAIQNASPIDSFVVAEPWEMPGYSDKVIMAAGCFVQGASIELSCDAPIKPPYIAYLQGGLTYEHGKIALQEVIEKL